MPNVPTITPGPDDSERMPEGATETLPLITNVQADAQNDHSNNTAEISDEDAYAKLKAKRAERRRKKLIRRGVVGGVVGGIALIAIVTTLIINAQPQGATDPVTDMVTEGTFTTTVEAKGQLKPISASVVSPSVDGTVEQINVQTGQSVNEGDVLMTIKNDELDRNVAEAQRAVVAAQEDLTNAQKAAAAAQAAPTTDTDGASATAAAGAAANASIDTSAVSAAQRSLASAQANLDQANAKAAGRTVTAPSSGSIVELNAKVGATVTGGMIMGESDTSGGKQCMQIADLSKMKVTVQVGEKDIAKIAVGQSANVTYPAFPDIVSQGTVTAVASVANSDSNYSGGSVTFNVDILIEAPDSRLKPGMTAEVSVVTEQLDDVVMVPTMALMTEDGENYYVNVATDAEGKETRRVKVTVVTQNDNEAVVGKTQVKRDDQGNEINAGVPTTKLRDGDTLVMDTGAGITADGGDSSSMSADEGM